MTLRRKRKAIQGFFRDDHSLGFARLGRDPLKLFLNLDFREHPLLDGFFLDAHHEQPHRMIHGGRERRAAVLPARNGNPRFDAEQRCQIVGRPPNPFPEKPKFRPCQQGSLFQEIEGNGIMEPFRGRNLDKLLAALALVERDVLEKHVGKPGFPVVIELRHRLLEFFSAGRTGRHDFFPRAKRNPVMTKIEVGPFTDTTAAIHFPSRFAPSTR